MTGGARPFRIGITGHRLNQLSEQDLPAISAAIGKVLTACERGMPEVERWTLISALAEGADRLGAGEALARGWRLEAPLPFARSRYLQDFETEASRAEFYAFCAAADEVRVAEDRAGSGDGYRAVGDDIVAGSDALIAVWKGAAPAGPGGTAHVISEMLKAGGAIAWINPADGVSTRLLSPPSSAQGGSHRLAVAKALAATFEDIPWPDTLP